jgi:hypothetical protein
MVARKVGSTNPINNSRRRVSHSSNILSQEGTSSMDNSTAHPRRPKVLRPL